MHSLLVTSATVARPRFATLARVREELSIKDKKSDSLLLSKIEEASSDIELALGFRVPHETLVETFRHDNLCEMYRPDWGVVEPLFLQRKAVASVTSVVIDDDTLDPSEYQLDPKTDALIRIDTSGNPSAWIFSTSIVVNYTAGYLLPGATGADLPAPIESATIELVAQYWASKGQNPRIKSESIPGVISYDYWVGAVGDPEQLPPTVVAKLAGLRRIRYAVA